MAKQTFPKQVFIYVCDYDKDGNPYYAVALSLDDIPEGEDGSEIGLYIVEKIRRLKVERILS